MDSELQTYYNRKTKSFAYFEEDHGKRVLKASDLFAGFMVFKTKKSLLLYLEIKHYEKYLK